MANFPYLTNSELERISNILVKASVPVKAPKNRQIKQQAPTP